MSPRSVPQIFQQYQIARSQFAQSVADMASRPETVEHLLAGNVIHLLRNLLTDVSPAIQQNAAVAVGRLAAHDAKIADLLLQQDIIRILLFFNMDKSNRYLKRAALLAIRSVVKHSPELAKAVIDLGGLEQIVSSLEEFDPGVKEGCAWVLGYIARHDQKLAYQVIGAGAVPLLVLCLQEPELNVRQVAASALSDICKHGKETAQHVIDSGAIHHLVRSVAHVDAKLKRQALQSLAAIAKHSEVMTNLVVDQEILPLALEHAGHCDELVRKAACSLVKEIVKHSPEMAQMMIEAGGLGVLVDSVIRNRGDAKLPGIMALGFIAGHSSEMALSIVYSKGIDVIALSLDDSNRHVAAAAAWALGHIGRHSTEHARHVSANGLLSKILGIYNCPGSTEDMKEKCKTALKLILMRTDNLEVIEPMITDAPPQILKYVVAQYSKVLPRDPEARRNFVTSGGLRKLQELLSSGKAPEGSVLLEHINFVNQCFPDDVVKYFSPNYPSTLLERVEEFKPNLRIDPGLWSERLFSDTVIPDDVREDIMLLQRTIEGYSKTEEQPVSADLLPEDEDAAAQSSTVSKGSKPGKKARNKSKSGVDVASKRASKK